jgi:hypothetical protein
MPAMANLVVKRFDGVTDITYDALAASGGDNSPAVWRQDTGAVTSIPVGLRQTFSLQTQWNGPRTARVARMKFTGPFIVQDSTTTLWAMQHRAIMDLSFILPQGIPPGSMNEFAYQGLNLAQALLIRQSVAAGYAPT